MSHLFSDAPDDFRFSLAACPGGVFPFMHLRNVDDRYWHGKNLHDIEEDKKRIANVKRNRSGRMTALSKKSKTNGNGKRHATQTVLQQAIVFPFLACFLPLSAVNG